MSDKHTPGPWEFSPPEGDTGTYEGGFYAGDIIICDFGDSETYYPTCGEAPNEANARLIAAAPKLLEAASALIDDVRARHPNEELRCEYMRNLDDAIAKAKGETQ